jgi:hypothetical protein
VWRHPTAFYWGGVDFTNPRMPAPKLAVICDAGNESEALAKELQAAIAKAGQTPEPLKPT